MVPLSRRSLGLAVLASGIAATARGQASVQLFRVTGVRDDVIIGLTPAEFDAMGSAPGLERLARKLVTDGQITAWKYVVGRAPDGSTRYAAAGSISILRNDALRIEPYISALPVAPPPAGR